MKVKKFCFINPPTTLPKDEVFFPMGPVLLGTLLKKNKIPVEILDFDLIFRQKPELREDIGAFEKFFLEKILESGADFFGISSVCTNFPHAILLTKKIREKLPQAKIIFGGPQPSSVPKKTLERFPFIDAVVIGEAERTLLELLKAEWKPESLHKVAGIAFRHGNLVHVTAERPLIDDLDELPFPDFSLVDLPTYLSIAPGIAVVEVGRGCPFHCSFCSTAKMWSHRYRVKSPERILREMNVLNKDYSMEFFCLTHDNFSASPQYVRRFCEYFSENNTKGLTWGSNARSDSVKTPDLESLYKAGCRALFYGVDSGSPRTQKFVKKNLNLDRFKKIFSETIRQQIQPTASFIIGFPEETYEDVEATLMLGLWTKKEGAKEVQFHRLSPLAGTKILSDYQSEIYFKNLSSDISIFPTKNLEIRELVENDSELFSSFYVIPTPHLEDLDLFDLVSFYSIVTNKLAPSFYWIFKDKKKTAIQLYREWFDYTEKKYPGTTFENGKRNIAFIQETFCEIF